MNVTSSRLVVDSSLSVSDARLVRPGDPVVDRGPGPRHQGRAAGSAGSPETPGDQPRRPQPVLPRRRAGHAACGRSSARRSSSRSRSRARRALVLAVPANALSVGGDGDSRVQVRRGGAHDARQGRPGPRRRRASWRSARPAAPRWLPATWSSSARGAADGRPPWTRSTSAGPTGRAGRRRRSSSCARSGARSAPSRRWWRCATSTCTLDARDLAGHRRAVGLGQVDAAEHPRLPGPARRAGPTCSTASTSARLTDDQRAALRAEGIGFVFQTFNLLAHRTVLENVMLAEVYRGRSARGPRRACARVASSASA